MFHADLALANRGDSSQKARLFVNYPQNGLSSRIEAAQLELDPSEATVIDLARRLLELGVAGPVQEAGLDILYDGPAGSLIGRLSSHDSSGDQAFDTPVKDPEATAPSGGSYPWRLDGARRTVVHLKNTTNRNQKAFVQVRWSGGFYTPAPVTFGPWESASIDLERVRGSAVPDLAGAFLPPEATSGQFVWYAEAQGALIGRAEVRTDALGVASSLSCPSTCCGLVRDSIYMDPGSLTDVVGNEGEPFIAEETRRDCYGIVFGPYDINDESQWASSNSSVASVSGPGHITCHSAGSTGITASFNSVVAFATYPTFCFAVVAGGVVGATLLVGDPTVTITTPPDNPMPSDSGFSTNFSFLSTFWASPPRSPKRCGTNTTNAFTTMCRFRR